MEKTVIVIGDVHGCIDELDELLRYLQYNKETERLVFLGDLMDRGPDPVGCVRRVRELNAEMVMGNHENLHIRWRKHEKTRELTGKKNPMTAMKEADKVHSMNLSDDDLEWMKNLPYKIDLGNNFHAVHGGMEPRRPFEYQEPAQMMRVRYVNQKGFGVALNPDLTAPEGSVYWTEVWEGPQSIVYGHCVHSLSDYRLDMKDNLMCLGLDTGCVFGGKLTAAIFRPGQYFLPLFVQVDARQTYYTLKEAPSE